MRDVLERGLREHGYIVDSFASGADAELAIRAASYDLAVLDWMLPGRTGPQVCAALRRNGNALPVLMLTARDAAKDRVAGLDSGADDYLVKPFDFGELLARLRALLRRPALMSGPILRVGQLSLDPSTHEVHAGARLVTLTPLEYSILELLMRRAPGVASRATMAENAWGQGESISTNALEAHIARLRAKVTGSGVAVTAVRGLGYRIVVT